MAVVDHFPIWDLKRKYNIVSIEYFLCECTEPFLLKHHYAFLWTSFRNLFYLEYMKKIHLFDKQFIFDPRPENCSSFSKKSPQKIV